ncbi:MAG: hypothetical protein AAGG07_03380 [Planctomycetota bacterium]
MTRAQHKLHPVIVLLVGLAAAVVAAMAWPTPGPPAAERAAPEASP